MDLRSLRNDPNFLDLPEAERAKVVEHLAKKDTLFLGLPDKEKAIVLNTLVGGSTTKSTATTKALEPVTKEPTFLNTVKQGFADFTSNVGGMLESYGNVAQQQYAGLESLGIPTPTASRPTGEAWAKGQEQGKQIGYNLTGAYETKEPTDLADKAFTSAKKALGDPLSWTGGSITKILGNVLSSMSVSGTAEVTGEVGGQLEKAIRGEETGAGRLLGSLGAGGVTATTQGIAKAGLYNPAMNMLDKLKKVKTDPDSAEKALAVGAAKRLLEKAVNEKGIDNVTDFVRDFNTISNKVNKQNLPLFVALADSPVIHGAFLHMYKTDDTFREQVTSQLNTLAQNIDKNADSIFGKLPIALPKEGVTTNLKGVQKRIADIDNKIEQATFPLFPSRTGEELGQDITNLVEAKKQAVKAKLQPSYQALVEEATASGIKLPSEATGSIYNYVRDNNLRDIFGKGTALDSKIMNALSPINTESLIDKQGLRSVAQQFPELSFAQVDSLKRNINAIKRERLSPEQSRKISQLEDVVDKARESLPDGFNQRLKDLDTQYYTELGVPYNAASIGDIDSKKYAELVAPVITRNGSSLKQFMSVAGESGVPIARNAIISEAYKYVKDGKVDLKGLASYMKSKRDILEQLPDVKKELQSIAVNQETLMVEKAKLDNAYKVQEKRLADSFLVGQEDNPDFTNITNRMLTNRSYMNKVLYKDLKLVSPETKKAVVNALRREFVDKAVANGDGIEQLLNPRNKYFVDEVFGSSYRKHVEGLLRLSDNVNKLDPTKIYATYNARQLDSVGAFAESIGLPGLDLPMLSSTARDKITSTTQKAVRLFSRVNQARVQQATNDQIKELLTDPDGLAKFSKVAETAKFKLDNPFSAKAIIDAIGERLPLYMYQSGKVGLDGEEQFNEPTTTLPDGGFY